VREVDMSMEVDPKLRQLLRELTREVVAEELQKRKGEEGGVFLKLPDGRKVKIEGVETLDELVTGLVSELSRLPQPIKLCPGSECRARLSP
jgi:uncharacterized protein with von Willebrand factor type A (vWA) domain